MINKLDKNKVRSKRHYRMRFKISGTLQTPRLNVYRSLSNIYAQVIDDTNGTTIASANTMEKDVIAKIANMNKVDSSKVVGQLVAERAIKAGVKEVVFDRGGYHYTGRIQALAEAAREAGLEF
ncbi:MAG: 50S ribosomal protein L18 [Clostridia bacterium]